MGFVPGHSRCKRWAHSPDARPCRYAEKVLGYMVALKIPLSIQSHPSTHPYIIRHQSSSQPAIHPSIILHPPTNTSIHPSVHSTYASSIRRPSSSHPKHIHPCIHQPCINPSVRLTFHPPIHPSITHHSPAHIHPSVKVATVNRCPLRGSTPSFLWMHCTVRLPCCGLVLMCKTPLCIKVSGAWVQNTV